MFVDRTPSPDAKTRARTLRLRLAGIWPEAPAGDGIAASHRGAWEALRRNRKKARSAPVRLIALSRR
jgi:hypothetical protein